MNQEFHPHRVCRYCPSCGSQDFFSVSEKAQSCKACGFIFYTNAAAAVAAIIVNAQGKILLTVRAHEPGKGTYDLPGGFVDPGETAEHALLREIQEELNLTIDSYQYFGSFPNEYVYAGVLYYTLDMVFTCTVSSFDSILARDDISEFLFTDITDSVIAEAGLISIQRILREYRNSTTK